MKFRRWCIKIDDKLILVNKNNPLATDYIPDTLSLVMVPFVKTEFSSKRLMDREAARALESLFSSAWQYKKKLYAASGYRSYQRQAVIFQEHVAKYGLKRANQMSAKAGESEHQTGLAMDITAPSVDFALVEEIAQTAEGKWLKEFAAQFGFIIRYPKGKEEVTGYQYEPWHLRYVGPKVATELVAAKLTLEEYLTKKCP